MLPGVKGETSSVKGNKINQVLISEGEGGMGMGAQGRQGGAVFLGLLVSPEKRVGPVDTGSPSPPGPPHKLQPSCQVSLDTARSRRIYFCIWFGRISVSGIMTTFFFPSSFPPIGRFYKPEQLPEGFQEQILHSF